MASRSSPRPRSWILAGLAEVLTIAAVFCLLICGPDVDPLHRAAPALAALALAALLLAGRPPNRLERVWATVIGGIDVLLVALSVVALA